MLHIQLCFCGHPLTGLTKKDAKLIWDDDCEQAFQAVKKFLVQPPVLAYPTIDGHLVLSTDASDTVMGVARARARGKWSNCQMGDCLRF